MYLSPETKAYIDSNMETILSGYEAPTTDTTFAQLYLQNQEPVVQPLSTSITSPTVAPVSTDTATPTLTPYSGPGMLDYANWGATDWRTFLPTPVVEEGYPMGESWIQGSKYYLPFSANGYDFTVDPNGYIKSITKDGVAVPAAHAEQLRYIGAGLLDPRFQEALDNWQYTPDKIDDYIAGIARVDPMAAAGILGQINDRGTVGWGSADSTAFKPETYWGAAIQNTTTGGLDYLSPELRAMASGLGTTNTQTAQAANFWAGNMTPEAQSAADDPDDMSWLVPLLIAGGGMLLGPSLLGAEGLFSAGAGGLESLAAADAMAGIGAAEFGGLGALESLAAADAMAGLAPSQTGILDTALNYATNYFTDPMNYLKAGVSGGGDLEKSAENLLLGGLTGAVGTGVKDLTSGLTDIPAIDNALAQVGTGVLLGQDPGTALENAAIGTLGGVAGGLTAGADFGGAGSLIDKYLPGAVSLGTQTVLKGGDLENAMTNYFINAGFREGSQELADAIRSAVSSIGGSFGSTDDAESLAAADSMAGIGASPEVAPAEPGIDWQSLANKYLPDAISVAAKAALSGGDAGQAVTNYLISSGLKAGTSAFDAAWQQATQQGQTSAAQTLQSQAEARARVEAQARERAQREANRQRRLTGLALASSVANDNARGLNQRVEQDAPIQLSSVSNAPINPKAAFGRNLTDATFFAKDGGSVKRFEDGGSVMGDENYIDVLGDWPTSSQAEQTALDAWYGTDIAMPWPDIPGYSVDPGPDPFATTTDVNKDWSGSVLGYTPAQIQAVLSGTASPETITMPSLSQLLSGLTSKSTTTQPTTQGGISSFLSSLGLGAVPSAGLGALGLVLAQREKRDNANAAARGALAANRPGYLSRGLNTRALATPGRGKSLAQVQRRAEGGYMSGGTAGQSDKIPAMLSDGEYVIDADTVAALGDGNNAAGASALDKMRRSIRTHKRSAPVDKIPPKAKRPAQYLKGAK